MKVEKKEKLLAPSGLSISLPLYTNRGYATITFSGSDAARDEAYKWWNEMVEDYNKKISSGERFVKIKRGK